MLILWPSMIFFLQYIPSNEEDICIKIIKDITEGEIKNVFHFLQPLIETEFTSTTSKKCSVCVEKQITDMHGRF